MGSRRVDGSSSGVGSSGHGCTCLLPNGLVATVDSRSAATFNDLKDALWREAKRLPLFNQLQSQQSYGLAAVNTEGQVMELQDEQPLATAKVYKPIFKLVTRKGTKEERDLQEAISDLIGIRLGPLDDINDAEIKAFRRNISTVCQEAVQHRMSTPDGYAMHRFPPNIVSTPFPKHLYEKLDKKEQFYCKLRLDKNQETTQPVSINTTPSEVIASALKKSAPGAKPEDYVLKVVGREEYFFTDRRSGKEYPMGSYKYIRDQLSHIRGDPKLSNQRITLLIRKRSDVIAETPTTDIQAQFISKRPPEEKPRNTIVDSLWHSRYATDKFRIKIDRAENVVTGKLFGVAMMAAVYLGDNLLCREEKTRLIPPTDKPQWGQPIEFDMSLKDIPRNARLCFALYGVWANPLRVKKSKKNFRNEYPLAWVNVSVLDFMGQLRQGSISLKMWKYEEEEMAKLLNPLGTTMVNISTEESPILHFELPQYQRAVAYPSNDIIGKLRSAGAVTLPPAPIKQVLDILVTAHPLKEYTEQELQQLYDYRFCYREIPCALSKCLRSVSWRSNQAANDVADMLKFWTPLKPEDALEILDASFADQTIRAHAVQRLEEMGDDKLLSYLLQLVQVLKYETYIDNSLARFLLRRALRSQRIGHFFFWYLKSEMHLADVQIRFGLLLEAYCRGCGPHMVELRNQSTSLKRIEEVTDKIKDKNVKDKKEFASAEMEKMQLAPFQLPLDPTIRLGAAVVRKVFDSAQKPLWLRFKMSDTEGEECDVMFKNGDDLRQDMLTLQLIRIMDQLWKEDGMDLQMIPYECLATGDMVGLLEMVGDSTTLWKIQGKVKDVWKEDAMDKWLHQQNPEPDQYDAACTNFRKSCAGYSVATYVLGIADRHNDNIMLKKDGRLFHIDFGHFLGNWKEKFGIKRERVKFILVPDFEYIITQGQGVKNEKWKLFLEECHRAFLVVRRNANLFINLLNMMLSTGIPELKSHKDVAYLRDTLFLERTEKEAIEAFTEEINTARRDANTVRVNWMFHGIKHR